MTASHWISKIDWLFVASQHKILIQMLSVVLVDLNVSPRLCFLFAETKNWCTEINGHEGMRHQKEIKESLDQDRVSNVVAEPSNDPTDGKEGFHATTIQVIVEFGVQGC